MMKNDAHLVYLSRPAEFAGFSPDIFRHLRDLRVGGGLDNSGHAEIAWFFLKATLRVYRAAHFHKIEHRKLRTAFR